MFEIAKRIRFHLYKMVIDSLCELFYNISVRGYVIFIFERNVDYYET